MDYQKKFEQVIAAYSGQHNILVVPRVLIEFIGSYEGAVLLNQMLYWSGKTSDGWFWKTYEQWKEELALSEYQVRKMVKKFQQMGFLETKFKKAYDRPVIYYKIDLDKLVECYENITKVELPQLTNLRVEGEETSGSRVEKVQGLYLHRLPTEITNNKNINSLESENAQNEGSEDILSIFQNVPIKRKDVTDKPVLPKLPPEQKDKFEKFWKLYPRKRNKADAIKQWLSINPDDEQYAEIMEGLRKAVNSKEWKEQDGRYIPYPATWLRKGRWLDEYSEDEQEVDFNAMIERMNEERRKRRVEHEEGY
jgi:hypothetical protein